MPHWSSWFLSTSLTSQRSRYQLKIAVALTVVIPLLAFCFVGLSMFTPVVAYSVTTTMGVMAAGMASGILGYSILRRYPANIERLHDYLERMASDDLPEHAALVLGAQDMEDIEGYLNTIIRGLQDKITQRDEQLGLSREMIRTIQDQSDEIIAAEQQRVMIESLGAACHHLGQPATVLSLYLSRVRDLRPEVLKQEEFEACSRAVDEISDILKKLKRVSEYRTRPYATFEDRLNKDLVNKPQILDINQGEVMD